MGVKEVEVIESLLIQKPSPRAYTPVVGRIPPVTRFFRRVRVPEVPVFEYFKAIGFIEYRRVDVYKRQLQGTPLAYPAWQVHMRGTQAQVRELWARSLLPVSREAEHISLNNRGIQNLNFQPIATFFYLCLIV